MYRVYVRQRERERGGVAGRRGRGAQWVGGRERERVCVSVSV